MNKKTYFITGGGTGGHIYPAVAVADELLKSENTAKITMSETLIIWSFLLFRGRIMSFYLLCRQACRENWDFLW